VSVVPFCVKIEGSLRGLLGPQPRKEEGELLRRPLLALSSVQLAQSSLPPPSQTVVLGGHLLGQPQETASRCSRIDRSLRRSTARCALCPGELDPTTGISMSLGSKAQRTSRAVSRQVEVQAIQFTEKRRRRAAREAFRPESVSPKCDHDTTGPIPVRPAGWRESSSPRPAWRRSCAACGVELRSPRPAFSSQPIAPTRVR
jgi:hypothetical protein